MSNTLLTKLGIPQNVLACKTFDEVLAKGFFQTLSEPQQIALYNYFNTQEQESERAVPYIDLEDCEDDFSIHVEGADTSVRELLDTGYSIRQCKDRGEPLRGLAAWMDEGDWKYLGIVYVEPKFRGRGIMGGLIEDGYDGKPISTKVHSANTPALRAFEKYGFVSQEKEGDFFLLTRQ